MWVREEVNGSQGGEIDMIQDCNKFRLVLCSRHMVYLQNEVIIICYNNSNVHCIYLQKKITKKCEIFFISKGILKNIIDEISTQTPCRIYRRGQYPSKPIAFGMQQAFDATIADHNVSNKIQIYRYGIGSSNLNRTTSSKILYSCIYLNTCCLLQC